MFDSIVHGGRNDHIYHVITSLFRPFRNNRPSTVKIWVLSSLLEDSRESGEPYEISNLVREKAR